MALLLGGAGRSALAGGERSLLFTCGLGPVSTQTASGVSAPVPGGTWVFAARIPPELSPMAAASPGRAAVPDTARGTHCRGEETSCPSECRAIALRVGSAAPRTVQSFHFSFCLKIINPPRLGEYSVSCNMVKPFAKQGH